MTILAVESSAVPASCAIIKDSKILSHIYCNVGLTHSQTLMPMIDNLLQYANISLEEIDAIACAVGPGSFTGVRIGISTVKGLAAAKDMPCIPLSTLECMAYSGFHFDGIIASVMDARCNQCYCALFTQKDKKLVRICNDMALSIDEFCSIINKECNLQGKKCLLIGDGAELLYNNAKSKDNLILSNPTIRYEDAKNVALLSEEYYKDGKTVKSSELLPTYLRLPQAERELKAKKLSEEQK